MAKKLRPPESGDKSPEATVGQETGSGSGSTEKGSVVPYVNERGEVCFGNECFNLAVDPDRGEVRVTINRDQCDEQLRSVLDELHGVLGKGARTVYETKSG